MDPALGDETRDPPPRLYERLRQIVGYTWDESLEPFHSSYDNWYAALLTPGGLTIRKGEGTGK